MDRPELLLRISALIESAFYLIFLRFFGWLTVAEKSVTTAVPPVTIMPGTTDPTAIEIGNSTWIFPGVFDSLKVFDLFAPILPTWLVKRIGLSFCNLSASSS